MRWKIVSTSAPFSKKSKERCKEVDWSVCLRSKRTRTNAFRRRALGSLEKEGNELLVLRNRRDSILSLLWTSAACIGCVGRSEARTTKHVSDSDEVNVEQDANRERGPPLYDAKSVPTRSSIAWKALAAVLAMLGTTFALESRLPAIQRAKRASRNAPMEDTMETVQVEPTKEWEVAGDLTDGPSDEEREQSELESIEQGLQDARRRVKED